MEDIIRLLKMGLGKEKKIKKEGLDSKILLREIQSVAAGIACADTWFEFEEDSDLLDSCIYYTESLRARYRYLLKKAKANNVTVSCM